MSTFNAPTVIEAPNPDDLGPKMLALNERQRKFVIAYIEQGTDDHTQAAESAGYLGGKGALRVQAHRLFHNPAVKEALYEETVNRLNSLAPMAVNALYEIASDRLHRDRVKAIKLILERTGFHAKQELHVVRENKETKLEQMQKVVALAKQLKLDPRQLLGSIADITPEDIKTVDAEFVEVEDEWCGEAAPKEPGHE